MDLKLSRSDFDAVGNYVGKFDLTQTYDGDIVVIDDEYPWTGDLTVPALKATGNIEVVAWVHLNVQGDVEAGGAISTDSGSLTIHGNLRVAESITGYGALIVAGDVETGTVGEVAPKVTDIVKDGSILFFECVEIRGNANVEGEVAVGDIRAHGELRVSGDLRTCEAWIARGFDIAGVFEADRLHMKKEGGELWEEFVFSEEIGWHLPSDFKLASNLRMI